MTIVRYFTQEACIRYGFPYIYEELANSEQAPVYESEGRGMAELEKVLTLVRNDDYYPSFAEKCAYIICSIAGSQYFTNGNKRLSITVLLMFLQTNDVEIFNDEKDLRDLLRTHFPAHQWEDNASINGAHSLFLYNLSIVIGDQHAWGGNFSVMRNHVSAMFDVIYKFSGTIA